MKIFKIIVVTAVIGLLVWFQRGKILGLVTGAKPTIASLSGPAHVINTLRFAVEAANAEAKTLVYHFSLDNCPPCERLDAEVLGTREWKDYARQNLKVIDIFMPNHFTSEDVRIVKNMEILEALTKATGSSGGFPTVVVFSSDGRILGAKTGYGGGGASRYISWIEDLRKQDPNRPTKPTPLAASVPVTNAAPPAEAKPAASVTPPTTSAPLTATPVAASPPPPAPTPATNAAVEPPKATPQSYLKLKGILGGASPMVMIHSGIKTYTVGTGDSLSMETPSGKISVRCDAVSKDSAVILVGETKERVELKLP